MLELTKNRNISELIASKRSLKELRKLLNTRDTSIREVFNSLGYFYNKSQHEWQREANFPNKDMTFNENLSFYYNLKSLTNVENHCIFIVIYNY